jgi:hypothetical protein
MCCRQAKLALPWVERRISSEDRRAADHRPVGNSRRPRADAGARALQSWTFPGPRRAISFVAELKDVAWPSTAPTVTPTRSELPHNRGESSPREWQSWRAASTSTCHVAVASRSALSHVCRRLHRCLWLGKLTSGTAGMLVISDREPLAWLLTGAHFAVPAGRGASVPPGARDSSSTRRAGATGTRNGIGVESSVSRPSLKRWPTWKRQLGSEGRQFSEGFGLEIHGIAPYGRGSNSLGLPNACTRCQTRHLEHSAPAVDR